MNYSFVYPIINGTIEEVVTTEQAIQYHKDSQAVSKKPDLVIENDQRLSEFISCNWAKETDKAPGLYIVACDEGDMPPESTHVGPYGFIKKKGNFWYIYKEGGWLALSGKPVGTLYKIQGDQNTNIS